MNSDSFCTEMLQTVLKMKKKKKVAQKHLISKVALFFLPFTFDAMDGGGKEISGLLCDDTLFLLLVGRGLFVTHTHTHSTVRAVKDTHMHAYQHVQIQSCCVSEGFSVAMQSLTADDAAPPHSVF